MGNIWRKRGLWPNRHCEIADAFSAATGCAEGGGGPHPAVHPHHTVLDFVQQPGPVGTAAN
jgi:hypothetical protein